MKKTKLSFVTMGIPSMFLIFSVLCLVILSLLTLGTARSDLRASTLSMEQTASYYETSARMTDLCHVVQEQISEISAQTPSMTSEALMEALAEHFADTREITVEQTAGELHLRLPMSDTQLLHAAFLVQRSPKETPSMTPLFWKTEPSGSWNPDTHQNVYKGELS